MRKAYCVSEHVTQYALRITFLLIILGLLVQRAHAHADLELASPAPGEQLAEAPTEIRLTFSEVVGEETAVLLLTGDFELIGELDVAAEPRNPRQVVASVPTLSSGIYTVQWTAVSADGHKISGSYNFQVEIASAATTTPFFIIGAILILLLMALGSWQRSRTQ
ncbi:MAG: copper resistance CopC family protein [Chloroflexota bacterium]